MLRSSPGDTRGSTSDSSASPILETLVVFVLVFVAQFLTELVGLMGMLFVLAPPVTTNPWTVVTSVYAHGGVGHLLSNSVALVVFGWPIARATTRLRFHTFFVVTGALAGLSQILLTEAVGTATPVLGASGAVFALFGYLLTGNRLTETVASRLTVHPWVTLIVFVVLAGLVTVATGRPGVALIAHFTGFLLGLVAGRARLLQP
ncbi:rhomboid family intramembrane serine protease [Natronobiforma cellulositropha]|uniref:rhomboid family intramembrane serine protease n=1 Tax=Natronobiforma cellulositropha TaxID=1679076 RepID=UPI0021D5D45B|nr:rhomboid family intramembrane serine protease [Natronobiforma cellulositropha]